MGTKPVLAQRLYDHVQQIPAESFAIIPQNDAPTSPQQPSLPSSAANNNVVVSISLQELRTIIQEEISTNQPQPQHHGKELGVSIGEMTFRNQSENRQAQLPMKCLGPISTNFKENWQGFGPVPEHFKPYTEDKVQRQYLPMEDFIPTHYLNYID